MKKWFHSHIAFFVILVSYLILFLPFLGQVHLFDWDEINFAEAAREMLLSGDWLNVQINFEPFWEKPPLFIWLQALSMKVFGVNEFAARFPNVLVGFVTLFLLYFPVYKHYSKQAAVFTVLVYLGSYTSHFYFKSGIIDPLFNLLMYLSILSLINGVIKRRNSSFWWAGVFLGLAVLTKGPVAILLIGLTGLLYQLVYRINFYTWKNIITLVLGLLLIPVVYFGVHASQNGWWFVQEFIWYQVDLFKNPVASHGQPFYYHFVVLLLGCFPMFILSFGRMLSNKPVANDQTFYRWMKVLFWVVLVVFSMVTTKIVHYSSMCYIPLAVVGGVRVAEYIRLSVITKVVLVMVGGSWIIILLLAGFLAVSPESGLLTFVQGMINDDFVLAQLATPIEWNIVPLFLAFLLVVALFQFLKTPRKSTLATVLVTNTLITAMMLVSLVPNVEQAVQGDWVGKLSTFQGTEMAHFTRGFKSYAHRFYTKQQDFQELKDVKAKILQEYQMSTYDMNEAERKIFTNAVRDYVIDSTAIPVSLSAKLFKFEEVKERYPNLTKTFEGNGYGVWERVIADR